MQKCPHCEKLNANKQTFCGSCGELIHIDPGFDKRVRHLLGQERRRSRKKIVSAVGLVIALAGYFGHQYVKSVIADGIAKATPVVEARIEAHLDEKVSQELPAVIARSEERVFPKVAKQLEASHQKKVRELEEGFQEAYQRQSKADEERFKASLAAAQPTLQALAPTYTYPFQGISDALAVPNTAALFSSTLRGVDAGAPTPFPLSCCLGLTGSSISSTAANNGTDCFLAATIISATVLGGTGNTLPDAGGCKNRFILPKPSDSQLGEIQLLLDLSAVLNRTGWR